MSDGKLLKTEAAKNEKLRRPNSSFIFGSSIEENLFLVLTLWLTLLK